MRPPPPRGTLLPYTTLFRSLEPKLPAEQKERVKKAEALAEAQQLLDNLMKARRFLLATGYPERRQQDYQKGVRSEEHTSELQSHSDLVCRLLLEKKNKDDKQ